MCRISDLRMMLLLVFTCIGVAYQMHDRTQVVVFDSIELKARLIRQLAEHQASEEQITRTTNKLKAKLSLVLKEYAQKHQVIIIEKREVLSGGQDVTEELIHELSHTMRSS